MTSEAPAPSPHPQQGPQQQDQLAKLLEVIADRSESIVHLIGGIMERSLNAQESRARFHYRMAWMAVFVVALVVGSAALLTYTGQVDGSAFTFLLGLVVGYILSFLRDTITPPAE